MKKRKKVLILTYYFNTRDTDRAYSVLQYFKSRNYDVELICGNYDHNSKKTVHYNTPEVKEIPVWQYNKNISIKRILSNIKFAYDVKKHIKKETFDIAYVISPPNITGYVNKKIFKEKGVLFVLDVFDLYPETIPINERLKKILFYFGLGVWAYLRNASIKKADKFIGSCNYYFTRLNIKEDERNNIVPLCKNDSEVQEIKQIPIDELRIIYLGALTGNYDFEGLVQIMIELKNKEKQAKLFIIGDGYRREWLLKELEHNNINYEYLGRIYDDEIKRKVFEKCHFGFNGFKDNASIALSYKSMEYMSNGLALINSCKEDTWNLVDKENIGINYKSEDITNLVQSILSLSEEQLFSMKVNALSVYGKEYSYTRYCERMDRIFLK